MDVSTENMTASTSGAVPGETAQDDVPPPRNNPDADSPLPQYMVVRCSEKDGEGNPLPLQLNPFQREQAFSKFGTPKEVFRRKDGSIEVQYTNEQHIKTCLKQTNSRTEYRVKE